MDTTLSPEVTSEETVLRRPGRANTLAPGHRIGQYELIRLLGRGGMGQVHLARDLRPDNVDAYVNEHGFADPITAADQLNALLGGRHRTCLSRLVK